jgi:hypothetical protein
MEETKAPSLPPASQDTELSPTTAASASQKSASHSRLYPAIPTFIIENEGRKRIYVTGDEGFVSIIAQTDADHYEPLAKLMTRLGARNSLFVPELDRFLLRFPVKDKIGQNC